MPRPINIAIVRTTPASDTTPVNIYFSNDYDFIIPLVFPDYTIQFSGVGLPYLGHAGILIIDGKTGQTRYGEYGRYQGEDDVPGVVRIGSVPNVIIEDGAITESSLKNTLKEVSKQHGKFGDISGVVLRGRAFAAADRWLSTKYKENSNKGRKPYSIRDNNCMTFVADMVDNLHLGAPKRSYFAVVPTDYMEDFQEVERDLYYSYSQNELVVTE